MQPFFLGFALVITALVIAGFARTFFLPLARQVFSAPWFVYAHAGLFLSWVALLITQAALVARNSRRVHQRVGRIALGLVPLMLASGVAVAMWSSARDLRQGGSDAVLAAFGGELADMLLFGSLATAALVTRRNPQFHKRFIVLATLAVLGAAVGRIPVLGTYANYVTVTLLLALVVFDWRTLTAIHRATAVGGLWLLVGVLSQSYVFSTPTWLALGRQILSTVYTATPS